LVEDARIVFGRRKRLVLGVVQPYAADLGVPFLHEAEAVLGLFEDRDPRIRDERSEEGVGDHGCEYMTGGRIVVLGETGINFAAGMSGGIAYVFDPERRLDTHCNLDMVDLEIVTDEDDIEELRQMIRRHEKYTGSMKAKEILDDWEACLPFFVKVFPMEYRRVLGKMSKSDEATEREEVQDG